MKKSDKKIILTASLLALAIFVTQPMHYPQERNRSRPKVTTELNHQGSQLDFTETKQFLELWSDYLTKRIGKSGGYSVSLSNQDIKKALPARSVKWIEDNGWDVQRFFYVEQRLRSIIKAASLKEQARDSRESLEQQLAANNDPAVAQGIRKLLEEQKNLYKIENVSEEEIAMVEPHLEVMKDILSGKIIYRPGPETQKIK